MAVKYLSTTLLAFVALTLTGCTLLPLKKIQPLIAPPAAAPCEAEARVHLFAPAATTFGRFPANDTRMQATPKFVYLLPGDDDPANGRPVSQVNALPTFADYNAAAVKRVNS